MITRIIDTDYSVNIDDIDEDGLAGLSVNTYHEGCEANISKDDAKFIIEALKKTFNID